MLILDIFLCLKTGITLENRVKQSYLSFRQTLYHELATISTKIGIHVLNGVEIVWTSKKNHILKA